MKIRQANNADASAIALLHAQSWQKTYRGIFKDEYLDGNVLEDRRTVWQKRLNFPEKNQVVFMAEENKELFGFLCAFGNEDQKWGTFIDNLHVSPDKKRRGIGTLLMKAVAIWSRRHYPSTGLYLLVLEGNFLARCFYEAFGASHVETRHCEVPGGGEVTDLCYAWPNPESISAIDAK